MLTKQRWGREKAGPGFYPFIPDIKRLKNVCTRINFLYLNPKTFDVPASTDIRTCLNCSKPLKGRIDKKFCDDNCRNSYNNQQKSRGNHSAYVRNINNTLLKNRRILESLLPDAEETAKANKDRLQRSGFQFRYNTHTYTTKTGKTYFFCYDYGYLPLDNDWYLIVRKTEE